MKSVGNKLSEKYFLQIVGVTLRQVFQNSYNEVEAKK